MARKQKANIKQKSASVKLGRRPNISRRRDASANGIGRVALPVMIIIILVVVLGFLGASGYRTATASSFFALRNIEVNGTDRTPADDVRHVVVASAEKPGVWNADLADIRTKLEKFPFVRSAAVSMVLPDGVRVNITERIPAAIVHLGSGDYLVDGEGTVLSPVTASDRPFPFVLQGWDESKTEKAIPENLARLKVYKKMLEDWRQFDLISRVKEVNLTNPRDPVAVVEDSGRPISITLSRDNLGKSLKTAIEAISGKGSRIRSVDAGGASPVIQYLDF